jgi:opacity protein-like surface antigen
MRRGILLLSLLSCVAMPVAAQPGGNFNSAADPYFAALGLAGGYTSGVGLALRWPMLPQVMGGIAGGAWGSSDDLAWNLGFEAHYVLRQVRSTRIFFGPGVGLFSDDTDDKKNVNYSLGVGVEYLVRERLAFKADIGFTFLGNDDKVYPLPQVGIFYYF